MSSDGPSGVRSSPRLAAAALAREKEAAEGEAGASSSLTSASARANTSADTSIADSSLQVPPLQHIAHPRRSVSFGPAVAESGSTTNGTEGVRGTTNSTQDTTDAAAPASAAMARTDSAKRRARISAEIEEHGAEKTFLPAVHSANTSGSAGDGADVASMSVSSSSSGQALGSSTPQALKPALKQGTQNKRLPPQGQYQHPDPLLRRLRLVDSHGQPINLRDLFKGVKVVAFYFSSQWAGQPLKEYHNSISELAHEHPSELRVIYVSVDVDEQWYKAGVKGQPWVSMVWNDGSSLPSPGVTNATSPSVPAEGDDSSDEPQPLHNNEDFLLAQEVDIDESLAKTDTSGEAYLRPFSRVHLASKLNIIAAPTVCIYHLERQRMLDWNVRINRLHRDQRDETFARWRQGEMAKRLGLVEALSQSPGTLALIAFALVYWAMILIGGRDWNIIRRAIEQVDPNRAPGPMQKVADAANTAVNQHVEF